MPTLIENLYSIDAIKSDIKSAIEAKGVDMTSASFADYPSKIGDITTSFVTETLSVSVNGTYYPTQGVDGFSEVSVNVPQSVTGFTEKDITEKEYTIVTLSNSASTVGSYCFDGNSYLNTVYLPSCETVNRNAFRSCSNLEQVDMPLCKVINTYGFQSCYNLKTVSLPLCERIESWVFTDCSTLSSLYLGACSFMSYYALNRVCYNQPLSSGLVLTLGYSGGVCSANLAIYQTVILSIYVPSSLVDAYKSTSPWNNYSDRIYPIPE